MPVPFSPFSPEEQTLLETPVGPPGSKWVENGDSYVLVDADGKPLKDDFIDEEGSTLEDHVRNVDVRRRYVAFVENIPSQIDATLPLEDRAIQAFNLRNKIKIAARATMTNRRLAAELDITDPVLTIEQALEKIRDKKGLTGDAAWQNILDSFTRTRASVNKTLEIKK